MCSLSSQLKYFLHSAVFNVKFEYFKMWRILHFGRNLSSVRIIFRSKEQGNKVSKTKTK